MLPKAAVEFFSILLAMIVIKGILDALMNVSDREGVIKAVEKTPPSRCLLNATGDLTAVFPTRKMVSDALLVPLK